MARLSVLTRRLGNPLMQYYAGDEVGESSSAAQNRATQARVTVPRIPENEGEPSLFTSS